jgi:hypothetical protein
VGATGIEEEEEEKEEEESSGHVVQGVREHDRPIWPGNSPSLMEHDTSFLCLLSISNQMNQFH